MSTQIFRFSKYFLGSLPPLFVNQAEKPNYLKNRIPYHFNITPDICICQFPYICIHDKFHTVNLAKHTRASLRRRKRPPSEDDGLVLWGYIRIKPGFRWPAQPDGLRESHRAGSHDMPSGRSLRGSAYRSGRSPSDQPDGRPYP